MNKAIISKQAFTELLVAAAEVYSKETYGYLMGKKTGTDFHIEYALTHQSTTRTTQYVDIDEEAEHRLFSTINFLKGHKYIGDFHSHPDGPTKGAMAFRQAIDAAMKGIPPKTYAKKHEELAKAMGLWGQKRTDKVFTDK